MLWQHPVGLGMMLLPVLVLMVTCTGPDGNVHRKMGLPYGVKQRLETVDWVLWTLSHKKICMAAQLRDCFTVYHKNACTAGNWLELPSFTQELWTFFFSSLCNAIYMKQRGGFVTCGGPLWTGLQVSPRPGWLGAASVVTSRQWHSSNVWTSDVTSTNTAIVWDRTESTFLKSWSFIGWSVCDKHNKPHHRPVSSWSVVSQSAVA